MKMDGSRFGDVVQEFNPEGLQSVSIQCCVCCMDYCVTLLLISAFYVRAVGSDSYACTVCLCP